MYDVCMASNVMRCEPRTFVCPCITNASAWDGAAIQGPQIADLGNKAADITHVPRDDFTRLQAEVVASLRAALARQACVRNALVCKRNERAQTTLCAAATVVMYVFSDLITCQTKSITNQLPGWTG